MNLLVLLLLYVAGWLTVEAVSRGWRRYQRRHSVSTDNLRHIHHHLNTRGTDAHVCWPKGGPRP